MREALEQVERVLGRQMFFVAGAPKSGTTWVQRILDAHPEIACAGEGHFADMLVPFLRTAFAEYNKHQKLVTERVFEGKPYYTGLRERDLALAAVVLSCLVISQRPIDDGVRCVGDKTPRYTFYMRSLTRLFPDAKFIHIIRDGRDVVVSTCYHAFRAGDGNVFEKDEENFYRWVRQFTKQWTENVRAAQDFGRGHPDSYVEVRYEDLQNDPDPVIAAMLRFLGVEVSDEIVAACRDSAAFEKLSGGRKPGEEKKTSFFRKGAVGDWSNYFDARATQVFDEETGPLLAELGYPREAPG